MAQGAYSYKRPFRLRMLAAGLLMATVLLSGCSTLPERDPYLPPESSGEESSAPAVPLKELAICYSAEDTLNPYTTKTRVNLDLASLLYSGLTVLDTGGQPQMALASAVAQTDPLHWTVTLRSGAVFSDGSPVTADDVLQSLSLAKSSEHYRTLVSNVSSASKDQNGAIIFTLASPDVHTAACLTFPILRASTVTSDPGKAPVGSGSYVYTPAADSQTDATLSANTKASAAPALTPIRLKNLADGSAMLQGLETNQIQYYFTDLADGEIPRSSKATMQVPLNYLAFLGINQRKEPLKDARVRLALSEAIGRKALCETSYSGWAEAAVSPFPSYWASAVELTGFSPDENIEQAVAQLSQAGYNTGSDSSSNAKPLSLELLVPEGNTFRTAAANQIQEQLGQIGVAVTVTSLTFTEYTSRLEKGDFDLYLGEIRLTSDLSLRPLLTSQGAASYGGAGAGATAAAYAQYLSGESSLAEFVQTFSTDLPYLPLCWRRGMAAYHRSMSQVTPTAFDIYYGIGDWRLS